MTDFVSLTHTPAVIVSQSGSAGEGLGLRGDAR